MTEHLHPYRQTYPLVNTDDELVMVFRSHIPSTHTPILYVKALETARFRIDTSRTLDDRAGLQVLDYTAGALDTVTITINGGAPNTLTEGTDFTAAISNVETAIRIADAINAATLGLTATYEVNSATIYVTPNFNSGITAFTIASSDTTAWTPAALATIGTVFNLPGSETQAITLPNGTSDVTKVVSFLKIISGRLAVDLRSPVEVRSYFRQPTDLNRTTGHAGGWPTTP